SICSAGGGSLLPELKSPSVPMSRPAIDGCSAARLPQRRHLSAEPGPPAAEPTGLALRALHHGQTLMPSHDSGATGAPGGPYHAVLMHPGRGAGKKALSKTCTSCTYIVTFRT